MKRREFFRKWIGGTAVTVTGLATLNSCNANKTDKNSTENSNATKFPSDCTDLSNVEESELKRREALGYVEDTPIEGSHCGNCKLYIAPKEGENCGGCMLFAGPVTENGYCMQYEAIDS